MLFNLAAQKLLVGILALANGIKELIVLSECDSNTLPLEQTGLSCVFGGVLVLLLGFFFRGGTGGSLRCAGRTSRTTLRFLLGALRGGDGRIGTAVQAVVV